MFPPSNTPHHNSSPTLSPLHILSTRRHSQVLRITHRGEPILLSHQYEDANISPRSRIENSVYNLPTHLPMRSQSGSSVPTSCVWNLLVEFLLLLPFLTVTQANDFSFQPQTPTACHNLTAQWKPTNVLSYSVKFVDKIANQTLFQAIVNTPSIEWLVNPTATSLHLGIQTHTYAGVNHNPTAYFTRYISTDFSLRPGTTICLS